MALNKAGVETENPKAEDVYRADGTTNQVFIETPPSEAKYSCLQKADGQDDDNDDTEDSSTPVVTLVNALTS